MNLNAVLNPDQRPQGGIGGPAPLPIRPRPADPAYWARDWATKADANDTVLRSLAVTLEDSGIVIESVGLTATTAQVRFRNAKYDAAAQAIFDASFFGAPNMTTGGERGYAQGGGDNFYVTVNAGVVGSEQTIVSAVQDALQTLNRRGDSLTTAGAL